MRFFYLLLLLTCCFNYSIAQTLAAFSGTSTPSATAVSGLSALPLSIGTGLTIQNSSIFEGKRWTNSNSIDTTDYLEWSLSSFTGFTTNITSIVISYTGDNKAPRALELRTSLDNFASSIFSGTIAQNSSATLNISTNITSPNGGTITFRLYGYNSTNANSSRLGINGNIGTILGLANTGITLSGTTSYDGLYYDGANWTPNVPSASTGSDNAFVASGSYTINSEIEVNDLFIEANALLQANPGQSITVNGDLTVGGTLELKSNSNSYSTLINNGNVSGNVNYKRHVNITAAVSGSDSNDLIAPPVSGEAFNSFITNNANIVSNTARTLFLFGPFDKSVGSYVTYSNTETATLNAGDGYRAASTDNSTFTFTGIVNTTNINKAISVSGPSFEEWNLIGNPYPSYIKLLDFLSANNSQFSPINSGIYGYDGNASNGWTIWNQAYSDANPNALVTPGQGFLLASKPGGGNILFTPSMRTKGTSDDFIVGRPTGQSLANLKLQLSNGNALYHTDLYFNDNASLGMDPGYDSAMFNNTAPSFAIYSHLVENNSGLDMAVQSVSYSDLNNVTIPLGINIAQGEQATVSILESNIPEGVTAILEDNVSNTFTDLQTGDYMITPNADLNGTGRFYLHFTDSSLSAIENTLEDLNIYTNKNDKSVVISGQLLETTTAYIYDLQGRIITTSILNTTNRSQTIDVSNLTTGVYVVQLVNGIRNKIQKIILH